MKKTAEIVYRILLIIAVIGTLFILSLIVFGMFYDNHRHSYDSTNYVEELTRDRLKVNKNSEHTFEELPDDIYTYLLTIYDEVYLRINSYEDVGTLHINVYNSEPTYIKEVATFVEDWVKTYHADKNYIYSLVFDYTVDSNLPVDREIIEFSNYDIMKASQADVTDFVKIANDNEKKAYTNEMKYMIIENMYSYFEDKGEDYKIDSVTEVKITFNHWSNNTYEYFSPTIFSCFPDLEKIYLETPTEDKSIPFLDVKYKIDIEEIMRQGIREKCLEYAPEGTEIIYY